MTTEACGRLLTKAEEMEKFLQLADSGAPAIKWKRETGMLAGDVRYHLRFINYYRLYVEMYTKIRELQAQRYSATSDDEKNRLAREVKLLRTDYRPRLKKARAAGFRNG